MNRLVLLPARIEQVSMTVPLHDGSYVVGRGAKCDIVVNDTSVSRRHARLVLNGTSLVITDLQSRNGTFVDTKRIQSARVHVGQEIAFGDAPFRLVFASSEALDANGDNEETGRRSQPMPALDENRLTASQRRVYELMLDGISEAEISARLSVSVNTVHTHVKAIYSQFCVHSRAELLAQRLRTGSRPLRQ